MLLLGPWCAGWVVGSLGAAEVGRGGEFIEGDNSGKERRRNGLRKRKRERVWIGNCGFLVVSVGRYVGIRVLLLRGEMSMKLNCMCKSSKA